MPAMTNLHALNAHKPAFGASAGFGFGHSTSVMHLFAILADTEPRPRWARSCSKLPTSMKVAVGGDHAGFELKEALRAFIGELGYETVDDGAYEYDALDDYPDMALAVAKSVTEGRAEKGVLICGSGVGASIAANKVRGVRASVCCEPYSGHQGVEHDDMNIVVIGSRVTGIEVAKEIVRAFLAARFSGEERHLRRLNKVLEIEADALAPHQ